MVKRNIRIRNSVPIPLCGYCLSGRRARWVGIGGRRFFTGEVHICDVCKKEFTARDRYGVKDAKWRRITRRDFPHLFAL